MGCQPGKARVVALCGSLKATSNNMGLVKYLQTLTSQEFSIDVLQIGFLPVFNQDLEKQKELPVAVLELRQQVRSADAVIFATPQYNGSISGVLKNAYDWLSRDYSKQGHGGAAIAGKKSGIISASYMTKKQIADVRRMGQYLKLQFAPNDYYVSLQTKGLFDDKGTLLLDSEKKKLQQWLHEFIVFVFPNYKPQPK